MAEHAIRRTVRFFEAARADGTIDLSAPGGAAAVWFGSADGLSDRLRRNGLPGLARHVSSGSPSARVAYLEQVRVERHMRGARLGSALVREAALSSESVGASALYLYARPDDGRVPELVAFYERLGFRAAPHAGPDGMTLMSLALTPTAGVAAPNEPAQLGLFDEHANPGGTRPRTLYVWRRVDRENIAVGLTERPDGGYEDAVGALTANLAFCSACLAQQNAVARRSKLRGMGTPFHVNNAMLYDSLQGNGLGAWLYAELARLAWVASKSPIAISECCGGHTTSLAKRVWRSKSLAESVDVEGGSVGIWRARTKPGASKPPPPPAGFVLKDAAPADRRDNPGKPDEPRMRVARLLAACRVGVGAMHYADDDRPDVALNTLGRWLRDGNVADADLLWAKGLAEEAQLGFYLLAAQHDHEAERVARVGDDRERAAAILAERQDSARPAMREAALGWAVCAAIARAVSVAIGSPQRRGPVRTDDGAEIRKIAEAIGGLSGSDADAEAEVQGAADAAAAAELQPPRRANPGADGPTADPATGVTPAEMMALWPVVSDWVGGGEFHAGRSFHRDLSAHREALLKLRPKSPLRVYRAATGRADEFAHPSAWTLDRALAIDLLSDSLRFDGIGVRTLLETEVAPESVWCSLEDLQAAADRMGLRIVIDPQQWREVILTTGAYGFTAEDARRLAAFKAAAKKITRLRDASERRDAAKEAVAQILGPAKPKKPTRRPKAAK